MSRVLCQAIVDPISSSWWKVTVTGLAPHDQERIYSIRANDDTSAAQEGLRRFVAETEALQSANG